MSSVVDKLYKYGRFNEFSESLLSANQIWFPSPAQLNDPFEYRPHFTFEGTDAEIHRFHVVSLKRLEPTRTLDSITAEADTIFRESRQRDANLLERYSRALVTMLGHDIGIYCLSRIPDSILMWSHYANNHCGFCLEFEATNQTSLFGEALPVRYSDAYPVVDYFNTPNHEQVDLIFLTKYMGWAAEQEWRIIDHANGAGLRAIHRNYLRA
jgi:hypothetical protein